jgi:large subunit ribosomal protein L22
MNKKVRMIITAQQTNSRQTPRKVRLVANAVKGLDLEAAIKQLGVIEKKSSLVILKVIRQAIANAMHNHGFTFDQLSLKNILVTEGPRYKRFRAVSRGRAHGVVKRTCHVTVELEAGAAPKKDEKKAEKKEVTVKKKSPVKKVATKTTAKKASAEKPVKKTTKKVTKKTAKKAAVKKKDTKK